MKVLLGIIVLHLFVILRTQLSDEDNIPYFFIFFISMLIVGYVLYMMFTMEMPEN